MVLDSSCRQYCVCEKCVEGYFTSINDENPQCPYCSHKALPKPTKLPGLLPGYVEADKEVIEVSPEEHDALMWGARIERGMSVKSTKVALPKEKPCTNIQTSPTPKRQRRKGLLTRCFVICQEN